MTKGLKVRAGEQRIGLISVSVSWNLMSRPAPGFRERSSLRLARAGSGDADPTDGRAERAAAITALYAQHAVGLTRLAYIMLGSQVAAEGVVQDAFCGLYRRWPHLSDQAKRSATPGHPY